jgi:hypothetical protein
MTALGRIQPHILAGIKDLARQAFLQVTWVFLGWGGWDSNPGPADYESRTPAVLVRAPDLGRCALTRSWSRPFGHVLGMIKLDAAPGPAA